MIKNITLGQYYPVKSRIHDTDPRVKLLGVFLYIVGLFLLTNLWGFLMAAVGAMMVIYASKVPFVYVLKSLKAVVMLVVFTAFFNLFFVEQGNVLFQYAFLRITDQGVISCLKLSFRIILLITGSSVLTLTTTPIALTDSLEFYMKPMKAVKVPVHEIAMMMTIALRFIPTLMEELDKIMCAQAARGADFETGGVIRRAKSLIPLMVPLFISSFRRAEELALAMEARCYRGDEGRTRMKELALRRGDVKAIAVIATYFLTVAAISFFI